nr:MAG TPA: hypothetical protein [Caudoviricetes sp.]
MIFLFDYIFSTVYIIYYILYIIYRENTVKQIKKRKCA